MDFLHVVQRGMYLIGLAGLLMLPAACVSVELPSTLRPEPQYRDDYDWDARHAAVLARHRQVQPDIVFIGDSITHHWGGEPKGARIVSQTAWDTLFAGIVVTNLGFGFDYVDNAYYRVLQGELDGISPRLILINIGTNNLGFRGDTPEICATHVAALVALVRNKQPQARILLIGVYPRREAHLKEKIVETNARLQQLDDGCWVRYVDAGAALVGADGLADPHFFRDTVHPNAMGYAVLAEQLRPFVEE